MIKFSTLFSLFFICSFLSSYGQVDILIYQENFNGASPDFFLNSFGPSAPTGNNRWIITNQYNGNGIYPNTPDETQVVSGTIAGAPTSNYLHIHNSAAAPGTSNANYNTSNASDNFAEMATDYCTLGLINVRLTFFYIAEGSGNDYGELYYSINGGTSWIKTGQAQYNNTSKWKSVIVTDPAFADQNNIRFGWRWKNSGTGGANKVSFGIDDIFLDGTYDNVNNPEFMAVIVSPSSICQGGQINVSFGLSYALCDGGYDIQVGDGSGSWTTIGSSFLLAGSQSGFENNLIVPPTIPPAACYKVRVIKSLNPPLGIFGLSDCFEIKACPHDICVFQPPPTKGPDTICSNSAIDVPFTSTGFYDTNNSYIAELSDAVGSFSNPQRIGIMSGAPASVAYDPNQGSQPGSISGLVPDVPAGCGYYIRVRSTSPGAVSPLACCFGPFCIKNCDIETNGTNDVQVCITDTRGDSTQVITIDQNVYNNIAKYLVNNQFKVQILPMKYDKIINTGGLGTVTAVNDTTLILNVPNAVDLFNLFGMTTATYYMRIIASNSSNPEDTLGTLVRLSIGKTFPPGHISPFHFDDFTRTDSNYCRIDIVALLVDPDHTFPFGTSSYEWYCPLLGAQNIPLGAELDFHVPPIAKGTWAIVREVNNGCFSPWSDTISVNFLDPPSTVITGPTSACAGDTMNFSVPFIEKTSYNWTAPPDSNRIITANNEISALFNSPGVKQISINALNMCGSGTSKPYSVTVNALPSSGFSGMAPGDIDTTICSNYSLTLATVSPQPGDIYDWKQNGNTISMSSSVAVKPLANTQYTVDVTNLAGCKSKDTLNVNVNPSPTVSVVAQDISCYGSADGTATAIYGGGTKPLIFAWSNTNPNASISNLTSGYLTAFVTDSNLCRDDTTVFINEPGQISVTFSIVNVSYNANDGSATAIVGAGTPPYNFLWSTNPPQNSQTVQGLAFGSYTVTVTDARGCSEEGTVFIYNKENAIYVPNAFSPNGDGINDEFEFYTTNLKEFHLAIYNRWGELVFESSTFGKKWNGTYKNNPEQVGAYAYFIDATFLDGSKQIKKGNITLVR